MSPEEYFVTIGDYSVTICVYSLLLGSIYLEDALINLRLHNYAWKTCVLSDVFRLLHPQLQDRRRAVHAARGVQLPSKGQGKETTAEQGPEHCAHILGEHRTFGGGAPAEHRQSRRKTGKEPPAHIYGSGGGESPDVVSHVGRT